MAYKRTPATVANTQPTNGTRRPHAKPAAKPPTLATQRHVPKVRKVDTKAIEGAVRTILAAIGDDPDRPGIKDTPKRVAKWWREFIEYDPGTLHTSFDEDVSGQEVKVSGMRVWSLCEHHLLPFWAEVTITYRPNGGVLGLSKFARIAHAVAHDIGLQERLVREVHRRVTAVTGSPDVLVEAKGEHLCMTMRGVRTPALMHTRYGSGTYDTAKPAPSKRCTCCAHD